VVLRATDILPLRELRNDPLWVEHMRPAGMAYYVGVSMPTGPGRTRRVLFCRENGPDFTDQEVAALSLLRPHLYELWLDAERRRAGIPALTRREWEVLHLVAAGHSNAEIATLLFVSVGTVRKHMEHVFDRLGVRNHNAATALALPHSPYQRSASWRPAPVLAAPGVVAPMLVPDGMRKYAAGQVSRRCCVRSDSARVGQLRALIRRREQAH
jgi:DNA-binding CsgD family transcriptional regulator